MFLHERANSLPNGRAYGWCVDPDDNGSRSRVLNRNRDTRHGYQYRDQRRDGAAIDA